MLRLLRKVMPQGVLQGYHYVLARAAALKYQNPSQDLIVIGVTGTNGKSTTVNFIAQLLTELGETVGYTSTAGFSVAGSYVENKMKMTMPGRFALQDLLAKMRDAKCGFAIVETSSQGLAQYRHLGINYDVAVFTNLTPEHLEAHGGFEAYKKAKGLLFAHLTKRSRKFLRSKTMPKIAVLNADDEHARYYAGFPADVHAWFGFGENKGGYSAQVLKEDPAGADVTINDIPTRLPLAAQFERKNALAAIATVAALGFPLSDVVFAAQSLKSVAGRFEKIDAGQPFTVVVDYAYEPYALEALFASVAPLEPKRILGIHGSAGGGRDIARRPEIGRVAALHEAITVITNEDPYDDNPQEIMEAVAEGARAQGKKDQEDLFIIEDRQQAIDFVIAKAQPGDVVVITGKGSEPVMALARGELRPWDDRKAARQALAKAGYGTMA
jgi:UDP-N-acetylmuramoyl-L-alanyl-D-glutamate--2,6-diaminopimelate ligase